MSSNKAKLRKVRWKEGHANDNKGSHILGVIPQNNVLKGRNAMGRFESETSTSLVVSDPIKRFPGAVPRSLLSLINEYGLTKQYKAKAEFQNHPETPIQRFTLPLAKAENKVELDIERQLRELLLQVLLPFVKDNWSEDYENLQKILQNPRSHFRLQLICYERSKGVLRQPKHTDLTNVPTVLLGLREVCDDPKAGEIERASLFRCHANGEFSRAHDGGSVYYGPGDMLSIRPGVAHFVEVPSCIIRRDILLVFLDQKPEAKYY